MSGGEIGDWASRARTVTRLVPYRIKKIDSDQVTSDTGDTGAKRERQTKDEKAIRLNNIPYTSDYIINCSMDDFNDILSNKKLNSTQLNLCREIRKRGKNKVMFQCHLFFRMFLNEIVIFK